MSPDEQFVAIANLVKDLVLVNISKPEDPKEIAAFNVDPSAKLGTLNY